MLKKSVSHSDNLEKIIEFVITFIVSLVRCAQAKNASYHFLSCKEDGFYLDDIKIINQKAKLQMLVFKALLTQHMGDILNGTSTYVSTKQINEFKKNGVHSDNYEVQIRKTVNKIRIFLKNTPHFIGRDIK